MTERGESTEQTQPMVPHLDAAEQRPMASPPSKLTRTLLVIAAAFGMGVAVGAMAVAP